MCVFFYTSWLSFFVWYFMDGSSNGLRNKITKEWGLCFKVYRCLTQHFYRWRLPVKIYLSLRTKMAPGKTKWEWKCEWVWQSMWGCEFGCVLSVQDLWVDVVCVLWWGKCWPEHSAVPLALLYTGDWRVKDFEGAPGSFKGMQCEADGSQHP